MHCTMWTYNNLIVTLFESDVSYKMRIDVSTVFNILLSNY